MSRICRSAQQQSNPRPGDAQHVDLFSINPGSAQRPPHAPAQFRLKNASSVGAVCGNDSSYINITDFSIIDGINSEHEQEQRSKDAEPTGRCGQQAPRTSGSNTGQYERSGSTPPRQPTPDRGVRTTYQTNAASTGDAIDLGRL